MKLYSIRGGTLEELENKKYNIGVGISLGNKWFNVENIIGQVNWCLKYSKEKVVIYVADSIHTLNIQARKGPSPEKSMEKALNMGSSILDEVKKVIDQTFSDANKAKIEYVHWEELRDEEYKIKLNFLYDYFETNKEFRDVLIGIVKDHISREVRNFSEKSIKLMASYILEELPECISRVRIGTVDCDAYVYPIDGSLPEFIEKVQNGEIFPEIKKVLMNTAPKVFLEVK